MLVMPEFLSTLSFQGEIKIKHFSRQYEYKSEKYLRSRFSKISMDRIATFLKKIRYEVFSYLLFKFVSAM